MIARPLLSNFFFLLISLLCFPLLGEESALYTLFSPPKNWQVLNPKTLDPSVKIAFSSKDKKAFVPSMNLVEEKVQVPIEEYLKIVKKLHESGRQTRWRNLGSFQTKAGSAFLTEIDTKADGSEIRILQLIFHQDQAVYLLTAACTKQDFPLYQKDFLESFRSLQRVKDLTLAIADSSKKSSLQEKIPSLLSFLKDPSFQKKHWGPFEKWVLKEFQEEGSYWQILMLTSLQKEIASQVL